MSQPAGGEGGPGGGGGNGTRHGSAFLITLYTCCLDRDLLVLSIIKCELILEESSVKYTKGYQVSKFVNYRPLGVELVASTSNRKRTDSLQDPFLLHQANSPTEKHVDLACFGLLAKWRGFPAAGTWKRGVRRNRSLN